MELNYSSLPSRAHYSSSATHPAQNVSKISFADTDNLISSKTNFENVDRVTLSGKSVDENQGYYGQREGKYDLNGQKTRYAIDLESQEVVIKVIDPETQEEIRQIPNEDSRSLSKKLKDFGEELFGT